MASPNYIISFPPPFPKINHKTTLNRVRALPSSGEERWEGAQSAERGAGKCRTLFAVHMAPGSPHCRSWAPGRAQAAASPFTAWACTQRAPQAPTTGAHGREAGAPGCCLCCWGGTNSLLSRGAQPNLHGPCCGFLPALNPKCYSFSEGTGRVNTFCVGGAKVPDKRVCPRSSSRIAPALSAAQSSNTHTCPVSCDSTRHGGCRLVCADPQWLCRLSVRSQHTGKRFPQQGHSRKGICNTTAPAGGRNNSDAELYCTLMPCTHSGGLELHFKVVCSASQTPKSA